MVGKNGLDDGILHEILWRESIKEVEVGVSSRPWYSVLNELESGEAGPIKRDMIRAAYAPYRNSRETEIP